MDFKSTASFYVACICICIAASEGTPEIMKELTLNEVTPQGLLNLPPNYLVGNESHLCHYYISFLKDVSDENKVHHKNYGISVKALKMELGLGDKIEIVGLSVAVGEGTNHTSDKVTWDSSSKDLEYKPLFKDICINFKGEWKSSKAKLLVTHFFEYTEENPNCPTGMTSCKCSNAASPSSNKMCISEDLLCNGVDNCANDCQFDETELASCPAQDGQKNYQVMKELTLNDATPQGLINLPPNYLVRNENHLCHYYITFLKDVPDELKEHHKNYGISVKALEMELDSNDTIEIVGLSMMGAGSNHTANKVTWRSSDGRNLEYRSVFEDICVNFRGNWDRKSSQAKLLLTLFYDNEGMLTDACPDGMTRCNCNINYNYNTSSDSSRMCISKDLICNGVDNCAADCYYDETELASCQRMNTGSTHYIPESCVWSNFGYIVMMVITGLLLIMIPSVLIFTLMYHRRMNVRGIPVMFDPNNNRGNGPYPHVITMPPATDAPPRYGDIPQQTKVPL